MEFSRIGLHSPVAAPYCVAATVGRSPGSLRSTPSDLNSVILVHCQKTVLITALRICNESGEESEFLHGLF